MTRFRSQIDNSLKNNLSRLITLLIGVNLLFGCTKKESAEKVVTIEEPEVITPTIDSLSKEEFDEFYHIFDSTFTKLQKTRQFNGVVLGGKKKQIVFKKAFGYRDIRRRTKLHDDDLFQLASVSKQFTAASIMLLKQDSLLAYSDSINKYFPNFPYDGITIKMLLDHRSGLPNYIYLMDRKIKDKQTYINNDLCVDYLYEYKPGKYGTPDRRFRYSNTGYMLLAEIVEKVSGKSFAQFLDDRIFTPLHMDSTFTFEKERAHQDNVAIGHTARRRKYEDYLLDGVLGDKSVYSNVEDMFKWHVALLQDSLFKQETLDEAFTFQSPKRRGNYNYGYGWRLFHVSDGSTVVYHGGWWRGYSTLFVHYPDTEAFLMILSNRVNHAFVNTNNVFDILDIPEFRRR
ncbi:class A beta-lactamase-related serine hydrolase [Flammeovirga pectinis]|uniref:Class A beta-lactamase-related serine hydrolase n=1 Tax=Flammeovirga pectinis TaxID=2494373 RepID=A0A3Q9FKU9_9BACT|nr:class A beta-lactamase-related serine hydrolase [Flammeovirga pectinis]